MKFYKNAQGRFCQELSSDAVYSLSHAVENMKTVRMYLRNLKTVRMTSNVSRQKNSGNYHVLIVFPIGPVSFAPLRGKL